MNNKIQHYQAVIAVIVLSIINGLHSYAGTTTMSASDNSPVNNKTVVIVQGDTVTLTTTTDNASAFVNYTLSSGVTGPSSDSASPGSPAVNSFSFDSTTEGQSNTIEVSTTHDALDANGVPCQHDSADSTFTVIIPQVTTANITGVPGSATNRVPIKGSGSIQGNSVVTIAPASLPSGTTIQFVLNTTGGGSAQFDNNSRNISLSSSGSLNIQGLTNSSALGDVNIAANLNGNADDIFDDSTAPLSLTVSTWPEDMTCGPATGGLHAGFTTPLVFTSESGNVADLGNCYCAEVLAVAPFDGTLFLDWNINGQPISPTTGGIYDGRVGGGFQMSRMGPDQNAYPDSQIGPTGNGTMTIAQQWCFQDAVLNTDWADMPQFPHGAYSIYNTVSSRVLTVSKDGAGGPFTDP